MRCFTQMYSYTEQKITCEFTLCEGQELHSQNMMENLLFLTKRMRNRTSPNHTTHVTGIFNQWISYQPINTSQDSKNYETPSKMYNLETKYHRTKNPYRQTIWMLHAEFEKALGLYVAADKTRKIYIRDFDLYERVIL